MKVSLITCSYAPDLERCIRLCESAAQYVDRAIDHVVVVPRRDLALFRSRVGGRATIITVESLLPRWVMRVPMLRKWWVTPCTLPVRGWIMQQITKLSVVRGVESDVLVFADSDVTFIRPFTPAHVVRGDQVRLHRVPGGGTKPTHLIWNDQAARLLGIPPRGYFGADYIGQLVSWRRDNVIALHKRLEEAAHRSWQRTLCGTLHFAEYILYGVFVEHVLADRAGHFYDADDLCHCSWHHVIETGDDLERFLTGVGPHHVAVLVQSYLPVQAQPSDLARIGTLAATRVINNESNCLDVSKR